MPAGAALGRLMSGTSGRCCGFWTAALLPSGYPDPEFPANKLHIGREPIWENVVFLDN
jgi:hypothetical protein